MLKRIAEDRKSLQEKIQTGAATETSPTGDGQKLGGKIQTNVDNNCVLMVSSVAHSSVQKVAIDCPKSQ